VKRISPKITRNLGMRPTIFSPVLLCRKKILKINALKGHRIITLTGGPSCLGPALFYTFGLLQEINNIKNVETQQFKTFSVQKYQVFI